MGLVAWDIGRRWTLCGALVIRLHKMGPHWEVWMTSKGAWAVNTTMMDRWDRTSVQI